MANPALPRHSGAEADFDPEIPEILGNFYGYTYLNLSAQRQFGVRMPGLDPDTMTTAFLGSAADRRGDGSGSTPLFVSAAAVAVDTRAALSHASIVSPELGVLCVIPAANAGHRIPDGARMSLDQRGRSGIAMTTARRLRRHPQPCVRR